MLIQTANYPLPLRSDSITCIVLSPLCAYRIGIILGSREGRSQDLAIFEEVLGPYRQHIY